jgi:queuine tRNA-ribosyltransferase
MNAGIKDFNFTVLARDKTARLGRIDTPRGAIRTPAFMPVGTAGTVKAMYPAEVRALGADVVLGNTYHLMLAPGAERIASLGGLHQFMQWPHPILTDSGGFQVMSLAKLRKLEERGVVFQSHIDGSRHELTPERSMEIQRLLGSDIQMQLDECVKLPCAYEEAERAMRLSLRWAERSKIAFGRQPGRAVFGIVQGGQERALRIESARELAAMDFPGYSIGGLAVGEPQEVMLDIIETVEPHLPQEKPRYLMGVGTPDDLLQSLRRGVDMFDCVMPTRAGRHGMVFTRHGRMNLKNAKYTDDARPIDEASSALAGHSFSRAYWRHLVKNGEILAMMALTAVNIAYYQDLMAGARAAIASGRLDDYIAEARDGWKQGETSAE